MIYPPSACPWGWGDFGAGAHYQTATTGTVDRSPSGAAYAAGKGYARLWMGRRRCPIQWCLY